MMHHSLWIKRKWKELLPVLNQLQKSLTQKAVDLSDVCDRNLLSIDFLLTMATVRKTKKTSSVMVVEDDEEDADAILIDNEPIVGDLQSKWSEDED